MKPLSLKIKYPSGTPEIPSTTTIPTIKGRTKINLICKKPIRAWNNSFLCTAHRKEKAMKKITRGNGSVMRGKMMLPKSRP
jgi:hypothetical protein